VLGAVLGVGVWLNRRHVRMPSTDKTKTSSSPWLCTAEIALVAVHVVMLVLWNFGPVLLDEQSPLRQPLRQFAFVADLAVPMGLVPVLAILIGRWAPYLVALPVVVIPIAGKTYLQLVIKEEIATPDFGQVFFLEVPILLALVVAIWLGVRCYESAWNFAQKGLITALWIFFALNWEFFHEPWPWQEWTRRTPNGVIFSCCAVALTVAAPFPMHRGKERR